MQTSRHCEKGKVGQNRRNRFSDRIFADTSFKKSPPMEKVFITLPEMDEIHDYEQ
jgi:hypothetical protein